jgi:hypothetical protein
MADRLLYSETTIEKIKEVIKEQPSYRNLSATATRVLQCTCPVAVSRKYFSAILAVQRQQLIKDNNYNSS